MDGDSLEQKKITNKNGSVEGDVTRGHLSDSVGVFKKRRVSFIIILILIFVIIILSLYRLFQVSRMGVELPVPDREFVEIDNSEELRIPESDLDPDAQKYIF